MRPKKGDLTRPRVKSQKIPKDSILLGNIKGNEPDAVLKRAKEFLKQNPLLSKNQLDNRLRAEGMKVGSTGIELLYSQHRRNLSRSV